MSVGSIQSCKQWNRHTVQVFLLIGKELQMTYVASPSYHRDDANRAQGNRENRDARRFSHRGRLGRD